MRNVSRCGVVMLSVILNAGLASPAAAKEPSSEPEHVGVLDAAVKSLTGDVYAEPSRWRPLSLGTLFTEGWDQAWASPTRGSGGAPRQGWIGAANGVFYRLGLATYSYAHDVGDNGDEHAGTLTLYTPFSRRFELRHDIPFVVNNKGSGNSYHTNVGDFSIAPRVILSESQDFTQSFGVTFRTPTGAQENGNSVAAITPAYEFWANVWRGMVVRGSADMFVPFGHESIREVNARTSFGGNLAAGYYFTPHDAAPFGDLVFHVATTLTQLTDDRGPNTTTLVFTPGFRDYLGANFYLLAGIDLPVTHPEPFDYQPTVGLMKVF